MVVEDGQLEREAAELSSDGAASGTCNEAGRCADAPVLARTRLAAGYWSMRIFSSSARQVTGMWRVVEDGQREREVAEERFPLVDVHRATSTVSGG